MQGIETHQGAMRLKRARRVLGRLSGFFGLRDHALSQLRPERAPSPLSRGFARAAAARVRAAARLHLLVERPAKLLLLREAEGLYRRALFGSASARMTPAYATAEQLWAACETYSRRVEARSTTEQRLLFCARLLVVAVVAFCGLSLGGSWLHPPHNLAFGRPVRASSLAFNTAASAVVDGNRYGQLGFHSDNEPSPWLIIDLGSSTLLSEVRVFGRAECCFDQSLPLAIEVSSDGSVFHEVGRRDAVFSQYEPWVFHPQTSPTARFVRLRTLRSSVLVLSEVEVYGRAAGAFVGSLKG